MPSAASGLRTHAVNGRASPSVVRLIGRSPPRGRRTPAPGGPAAGPQHREKTREPAQGTGASDGLGGLEPPDLLGAIQALERVECAQLPGTWRLQSGPSGCVRSPQFAAVAARFGPTRAAVGPALGWNQSWTPGTDLTSEQGTSSEYSTATAWLLAFIECSALAGAAGVEVARDLAAVYRIRDGLIASEWVYLDRAEALEAAGLRRADSALD